MRLYREKLLVGLFIFFAVFSSAFAQQKGFTITGKLNNLSQPAKVFLCYDGGKSNESIDSVMTESGVYQFSGSVKKPGIAMIYVNTMGTTIQDLWEDDHINQLRFFLENTALTVSAVDSIKHGKVSGSRWNDEYQAYTRFVLGETDTTFMSLRYAIPKYLRNSAASSREIDVKHYQYLLAHFEQQLKFVALHPDSYFSLYALTEITRNAYITDVLRTQAAYNSMAAGLRNTPEGQHIAGRLKRARPGSKGMTAPDFVQYDQDGKPVSLSSYRGKYILLYFWALGNDLIKVENYWIRKAYDTYKDKNLVIIGICTDDIKRKSNWLKNLQENKLPWTQVAGMKAGLVDVAKLYGIQGTPESVLITPDGKIASRSLNGAELQFLLAESIVR
ncbi:TlpA disulfide reductase family protein [Pedobacter cryoconitis]|uniref:Peroxiredoxin n=1 Tax=Pedobacter cryoconitis TaxID=188932 RepID=A0A7X0J419_9SPHI|nr:TlpA disulfide reductase family protein [Pedobacter cryoconitis]MBB6500490.1 peroxiredoxin [Pedobacter cryoconitis]